MPPKKVLIIDKDKASRGYLAKTLLQMQYTVEEASLGKEGLVFTWGGRPDLIILDPALADLPGEEIVRKLRKDQRSANLPIIALSSDPSPTRKNACLEAGVNQYLLKSMEAIPALLKAVDTFLRETERTAADKEGGLLIVFLSSKGGMGTSSLCANLGMNIGIAYKEARVALVDAVLPIGSIAHIVGYEGEQNLVSICSLHPEKADIAQQLNDLPALPAWHFQLLAGSPNPQSANKLHASRIESVINTLQANYDFILVDIGRTLSRISLPLIKQADLIVLVLGNDSSTVTLTKIVWQYLGQQGISQNHMYAWLNRAVGLEGLTKSQIETILGLEIRNTMPYLGDNFALANNQHIPITTKFPTQTASTILREAAKQIVTQAQKIRAGYSGN